jgi:membrane protein
VVRRQIGLPTSELTQDSEQALPTADTGEKATGFGDLSSLVERRRQQTDSVQALGPVSRLVGVGILLFSATGVLAQLQLGLNRAWKVAPDPEQGGWKNFVMKRVTSLGMIVVIAFLLLVSLVLTTILDELIELLRRQSTDGFMPVLVIVLNNVASIVMATILFAAVFKVLPDVTMRWKDVWMGALMTALLFVIGKGIIAWYLQRSQIGFSWGSAASSMVSLLIWVYYSSLIVLFGAELTQVWSNRFGAGTRPTDGAARMVQETHRVHDQPPLDGDSGPI